MSRRASAKVVAVVTVSLFSSATLNASPLAAKPSATKLANVKPSKALTFQKSTVSFATAAETAELLVANDPYKQQLSPTDRQLLAVSANPVSPAELDVKLRAAAREFTDAEKSSVKAALAEAAKRLDAKGITLKLPATVVIAKHDGAIFSGSPYTRANAIFLNDRFLGAVGGRTEYLGRVMAHELWHVASRAHPESRAAVYKLVGFTPCNVPLSSLGADVRPKIITNPDTEDFGTFCVSLPDGSATKRYTNLIIATAPVNGTNFREVLKPVLVEVNATETSAVVKAGKTSMRDLDAAYAKAIGGNGLDEPYHPEEIVAKNLETALVGKPSRGSPSMELANQVAAQLGKP